MFFSLVFLNAVMGPFCFIDLQRLDGGTGRILLISLFQNDEVFYELFGFLRPFFCRVGLLKSYSWPEAGATTWLCLKKKSSLKLTL